MKSSLSLRLALCSLLFRTFYNNSWRLLLYSSAIIQYNIIFHTINILIIKFGHWLCGFQGGEQIDQHIEHTFPWIGRWLRKVSCSWSSVLAVFILVSLLDTLTLVWRCLELLHTFYIFFVRKQSSKCQCSSLSFQELFQFLSYGFQLLSFYIVRYVGLKLELYSQGRTIFELMLFQLIAGFSWFFLHFLLLFGEIFWVE